MDKIGIIGMSCNPPHRGHEMLIAAVLKRGFFDKIFLVLTGNRKEPDKQYVHPDHRVAMSELAFGRFRIFSNETDFFIRYSDIYTDNTPTITLLRNFQKEFPSALLTFVVGSDLVCPIKGEKGKCVIEKEWVEGEQLLKEFRFLIVPRRDYPVDLIPERKNYDYLNEIIPNISSSMIRYCIKHDVRYIEHVSLDVCSYISKHKLYE